MASLLWIPRKLGSQEKRPPESVLLPDSGSGSSWKALASPSLSTRESKPKNLSTFYKTACGCPRLYNEQGYADQAVSQQNEGWHTSSFYTAKLLGATRGSLEAPVMWHLLTLRTAAHEGVSVPTLSIFLLLLRKQRPKGEKVLALKYTVLQPEPECSDLCGRCRDHSGRKARWLGTQIFC